jgi:hypothetical protein
MKLWKILPTLPIAAACTNDPVYIDSDPAQTLEVGVGMDEGTATTTLNLPYDAEYLNGEEYTQKREELLASINETFDPPITIDQLPYVRLDQVDISVEWTITNLDAEPGEAFVDVNGGNQYFYYVPAEFVVDPDDEDEPQPPPLAGHVPIEIPANGSISGVFREDQLREAALDLDLITRFTLNPFFALLNNNEEIQSTEDIDYVPYPPPEDGEPITPPPPFPVVAMGHFVRLDITFIADRHMILEYAVRVRDPDGLLHDELLAADPAELMPFMPAMFVPDLGLP